VRVTKESFTDSTVGAHGVPFRNAARFWVKLGFINFGGPTGQIAIMHDELVEKRRWVSNRRFLHALNFCMLLPGPEAHQLAIYIGWLLHKVRGGLLAGISFLLPAFFLMMGLSWVYVVHGDVAPVAGILSGLQAAVVGIVAAALIRIGRRALHSWAMAAIAAGAFVAIFAAHVPFPYIVLTALVIGYVGGRMRPDLFRLEDNHADGVETAIRDDGPAAEHTRPSLARAVRVLLIGGAAWVLPLIAMSAFPGAPQVLRDEALFFSTAAMVTFGGAYAVLAYINQAAVQDFGWLRPGQMVTGLGLAESTPGPLILVTEFVGFLAGYQNPGGLDPLLAGMLGATVATWATFAPSFLWVFLGAPYIERLRDNRALTTTLAAVTAAVVGVILNLAVTFGLHTLFEEVGKYSVGGISFPAPTSLSVDLFAVGVAVFSFVALWRFRLNILWVVLAAAAAGLAKVALG
jgi:chromate transporter